MDHVGIDLGKRDSQIAILTEEGELINRRIRTGRPRLAEMFGRRPKARILLEASTGSPAASKTLATRSSWLARITRRCTLGGRVG
jgi:hypothetical protein